MDCSERSLSATALLVFRFHIPYCSTIGPPWLASLSNQVDDVRLGLPYEYAPAVLEAASNYCAGRFPAGTVGIVEAAHGLAGSSVRFFR